MAQAWMCDVQENTVHSQTLAVSTFCATAETAILFYCYFIMKSVFRSLVFFFISTQHSKSDLLRLVKAKVPALGLYYHCIAVVFFFQGILILMNSESKRRREVILDGNIWQRIKKKKKSPFY